MIELLECPRRRGLGAINLNTQQPPHAPAHDPIDLVRGAILDKQHFIKATFQGQRRGKTVPWKRVILRPVLIQEQTHLQFSFFDAKQDVTKNYSGQEVAEQLNKLLALPFRTIYVQTSQEGLQVQFSKKGKALIRRHAPPASSSVSLEHDRRKRHLLPADHPDPFLQAIGIMTESGQVRANMRRKFRQINAFLELVIDQNRLNSIEHKPLHIVDCGCGSAHLTFAMYHYLNHILHIPTHITGVDVNQALLESRAQESAALGWLNLTFEASAIIDFVPQTPPDIVLALHACDTATDEALAQAVRWQSRMIFGVPCCHHHMQQQLAERSTSLPIEVRPMLYDGILKERLGDVLTDTLRAMLLRSRGYRTEVIEFISAEHTDKNLMIRAVKQGEQNETALMAYEKLRDFWQVRPYLEELI